jgi:glycosyltransferase involved in cell wall biosynthesis
MSKSPKISVLMACYNAESFVVSAVESVINQTFTDFEIILVNDGSTDRSIDKLNTITDDRFRWVTQQNQGASSARNEAFRLSTGDYVIYFDADDLMKSTHLEMLFDRVQSESDCVAFSPWVRFTKLPLPSLDHTLPSQRDMAGPDWLVTEWRYARPMMQAGMFLIPRHFVENHGGWDPQLSLIDDFEFYSRIISKVKLMAFAPDAGLYYRSEIKNSLSTKRSPQAIKSALVALKRGTEHVLAAIDTPEARLSCANCLQDFVFLVYPDYRAYRREVEHLIDKMGGSDLLPDGPPGFQRLRKFVGWKLARQMQRVAERLNLNSSALKRTLAMLRPDHSVDR